MSLEDERRRQTLERKRNLVHLISQYLRDCGLLKAQKALIEESNLGEEYQVCDNIDLDTIYLEFCSLFQIKFGKKPKVLKRLQGTTSENGCHRGISIKSVNGTAKREAIKKEAEDVKIQEENGHLRITARSIFTGQPLVNHINSPTSLDFDCFPEDWKDIVDNVCRTIVTDKSDVTWSQVQGAGLAKNILREAVILPIERPELFQEIHPWRSVLLHGPSGTGKTMIAKALSTECSARVTFFNVTSSAITSKWRGESEKYIRVLFEVAARHSPAVIFIDEIEGLTSRRDTSSEHESSRKFKNEFLTLMDGLHRYNGVFLLCNSNLPWDIDDAFLRRFEQKILIGLPLLQDRIEMLRQYVPAARKWPEAGLLELGVLSDGFTGDDIRLIGKQIDMIQIRKALHQHTELLPPQMRDGLANVEEVKETISHFKSKGTELLKKHILWNQSFGSYHTLG